MYTSRVKVTSVSYTFVHNPTEEGDAGAHELLKVFFRFTLLSFVKCVSGTIFFLNNKPQVKGREEKRKKR